MLYERKTYDAWLASAELPYDLLILLLQALKTSENVYASFEKSGNPVFQLIPDQYRKRMKDNAVDLTLSFFQNQIILYHYQMNFSTNIFNIFFDIL